MVVIALGHFAAVEPRHGHQLFVHPGPGNHQKIFLVIMVDHSRDVLSHFNMLHLILAYRNVVGIEEEDIGSHQHRIGVDAHVDLMIITLSLLAVDVHRGLVGVSPVHQTLGGESHQDCGEFEGFRNIGLFVDKHLIGVKTGGQPDGGDFMYIGPQGRRIPDRVQRMIVGNEEPGFRVFFVGHLQCRSDSAEVIAQMGHAGGFDSRQNDRFTHGW